jgi:hypothetical protein
MKKLLIPGFFIVVLGGCQKQSFEIPPTSAYDSMPTIRVLWNKEGYLERANKYVSVITIKNESGDYDENDPLTRFVPGNLPAELKDKKKVRIVFSGQVREDPYSAQSARIGTPLKLTQIKLK